MKPIVVVPTASLGSEVAGHLRLSEQVIPALLRLRDAGFGLLRLTSNGERSSDALDELFASQGIVLQAIDAAHPHEARLLDGIDRVRSAVVGSDEKSFAAQIGISAIDLGALGWLEVAHRLIDQPRRATSVRATRETSIRVTVDLDGTGCSRVNTGIAFFDHMLDQLAKNARIDLEVDAKGDLIVDEHHTVEDTAIVLGQAIRQALGPKVDIARYGFVVPMDEAEARVSFDLSGRAHFLFTGAFPRESVGGLHTEMVSHFYRSFADALGAALHLEVRGENSHHMVESTFKAVGRALGLAVARARGVGVPSTKGTL